MSENNYKYYLEDLVCLLKEKAEEVREDNSSDMFEQGRLMAYYEVLSLLLDQASAFSIDFKSIGLDMINPDKYLTGTTGTET